MRKVNDYCTLDGKYKFGLVGLESAKVIRDSLSCLLLNFGHINILEVGVHSGETGIAMTDIVNDRDGSCMYVGIDKKIRNKITRDAMFLILGDANDPDIVKRLPVHLHFILLDSCHCFDCVTNQFKIYSPLLASGGIFAFHDTAEQVQGDPMEESCHPEQDRHISVNEAIRSLDLSGYELFKESKADHGIQCYIKK